ncbi:MAG: pilus assembly protein PilM [Candidatus Omnitrophica bacterium]|nr:pilus assembly protein PilM [Candidatus Omnitrophota bacterium]
MMIKANVFLKAIQSQSVLKRFKKSLPISQFKEQVRKILRPNDFLKTEARPTVGLNIGNYYLKGLIFKGDSLSDYFIEPNEDLVKTLGKVWAQKKISAKSVKISIKNPSCLVRYFSFPKMEKKRLEQALFYELNKHIPFSPEEVYFDYYILKDASPTELSILLAVAKKDYIDNILEAFKTLGVEVSEINLDSICIFNLFLDNCSDNKEINSCILDIGSSFSVMTIVNKGVPFLTRDVKFSTKDIVAIVARTKGLKPGEVEKQLVSSPDAGEFLEFIQSGISGLCKEMKSSFDYFEVNKGEHIDKVYLTGGLASIKDIESVFAEALDVEVSLLPNIPSFLKKLDGQILDERFNHFKSSFSAAFGLIL